MDPSVGLLINFGAPTFKDDIKVVVKNYKLSLSAPPRLRVSQRHPG